MITYSIEISLIRYTCRGGATLFVGNIHEKVSEQEIRDEFGRIGRLRDVRMGFRKAVDGRQHAFVDFEDPRDAEDAHDRYSVNLFKHYKLVFLNIIISNLMTLIRASCSKFFG